MNPTFNCRWSRLALSLLLGLSACADNKTVPAPAGDTAAPDLADTQTPTPSLSAGPNTELRVTETHLYLERAGSAVVSLAAADLQLGVVPSLDDGLNYDPGPLAPGAEATGVAAIVGLKWIEATRIEVLKQEESRLELALALEDERRATLVVTTDANGRFSLDWKAPETGSPCPFFRFDLQVDESEGFYGMGEVFDAVEHRGTVRPMQFAPSDLESGYNEVHVPIPFLIGTTGWGVFVQSYAAGVFSVAKEADDRVTVIFGPGPAYTEGLQFHLFTEAHPLDITQHYYDLTGYPGPYAPWALGPWIWRDEVEGQDAVENDLDTIRSLDLATTGYWIDRPFASAVNSFDFEPSDYTDPAAMMAYAADRGFEMALWHTPYLDPNDEDSLPLHDEAMAAGYFPPIMGPAQSKWGPPLDFSNPDAFVWWQEHLRYYTDLGFVGFKLDYAEEVVLGLFGARIPWLFDDGTNELTMHRRYQLFYHQVYAELLPETGGFLLCRAGAWGDQAQGAIIWPGDLDANMAQHGELTTDADGSEYRAVGGLPAAVIAGSSLGPSGFPLFGSDTGGYRHSPPDRETYLRWIQHTALSTVMQVGTNTNDLPWALGPDKELDSEVLDTYRHYARLHLRLHPYLWTYIHNLASDGRAIQRPLGLAYPELGVHPSDIYLLGDHILAAPVVRSGVTARSVTFPPGEWLDWWSGERIEGGQTVEGIPAPLTQLPLYVRAGALIPLLRPTIDTLSPVTDPEAIDSYATDPNPLYIQVTAGPEGQSVQHDGSELRQEPIEKGTRLRTQAGSTFHAFVFEFMGLSEAPEAVHTEEGSALENAADLQALNAQASGWAYDATARGGTLWIKLGPDVTVVEVHHQP